MCWIFLMHEISTCGNLMTILTVEAVMSNKILFLDVPQIFVHLSFTDTFSSSWLLKEKPSLKPLTQRKCANKRKIFHAFKLALKMALQKKLILTLGHLHNPSFISLCFVKKLLRFSLRVIHVGFVDCNKPFQWLGGQCWSVVRVCLKKNTPNHASVER